MLSEFPSDARVLLRRSGPDQPFCEKARIIEKYIHELERPVMPNHSHPLCDVYNDDVAVGLACIAAIRWEMSEADSRKLPRAIHSRLRSIGVPILEWCLWILEDMSFAFRNCDIHNTIRIDSGTEALVVLNSFISDPRGLQLVLRRQEVVGIVVHAWASVSGLAYWRDAVVPVTLLLDKLHSTPQLHDLVVETLRRYTPAVPLQILRHVAAFSHRDLDPLPDPKLERLSVEVHIHLMTQLCQILPASDCTSLLIRHKAPKWVCRTLARVLTIPFKDWASAAEVLMNPFEVILTFLGDLFEADSTLISMKAALHHQLVQSLVRCLSEVSRQNRLGQKNHNCAPVLVAVIMQVCLGVRMSGTILRLACRAMDRLDLAHEEKERFISKDEASESVRSWAAWDVLKDEISRARKKWVVDPNVRSGWRCMNPQVGLQHTHCHPQFTFIS